MEENKEMKNGIISEEALDQIAGGFNIKKAALIASLTAASVAVVSGTGYAAWKLSGKKTKPHISLLNNEMHDGDKILYNEDD